MRGCSVRLHEVSLRFPTGMAAMIAVAGALGALTPARAGGSSQVGHAAPVAVRHPSASPVAGHWEADMQGDGRRFTFLFDFTVKGDSLGGVLGIAGRDGDVPIAGTWKGNKLHFEQFGLWNGVLEGANLKLSRGLDGGKVQHMTAHRAPGK
jgi:hypothetical protein